MFACNKAAAAPVRAVGTLAVLAVFGCWQALLAQPHPQAQPKPGNGQSAKPASDQPPVAPNELALPDALNLALARNPALAALQHGVRAAEAAITQAQVRPNPTLDVAAENLGNRRLSGDGDRSMSLQLGQTIELGGKRAARTRVAETARDLARWDYRAKRLAVTLQVKQAFVDVLAAQQKLALAGESAGLAQRFADAVAKRVQAGKVSPVEETKARLELSTAQIQVEQAKRELEGARNRLSATWDDPSARFQKAVGDLATLPTLLTYAQLAQRVSDNPDLARWSSELASKRAAIDSERAKAVGDLGVGAGVSRYSQFDDHAYSINLSLPLPLFDRNRGGVLEANRRLDQAMEERRAARSHVLADLAQTYSRSAALRNEVQLLRSSVLPAAQSAFDAANKGYQLGKFGFLDVLDAQRTLFQVRAQYLQALADEHRARIEIERLVGATPNAQPNTRP